MAADIAFLVSSYLDGNKPTNLSISTLLEAVSETQSLQGSGCTKEWIGKLNSLLNSNNDRWLGIALLGPTLQQCNTDVFTANCISWMKVLQHILELPTSSLSLIQTSVTILDDLMRYTTQFPELMRNTSNSTIPAILSALLSLQGKDTVCSLVGICACLKYFPGPSSQFKTQIEDYLISCLDRNSPNIRKYCAQCFALVAGLSNNQNDKQKKNWDLQWYRVVGTLNVTLDILHAYESTTSEIKIIETLPVKTIETDEPKKTNTCTSRLRSLLKCLDAMIRQGSRRVSMVPLDITIALLERVLSLNGKMLRGSISVDNVLLQGCLPLIHLDAVHLLCSLVQRCGSLLLPNANRIAKLMVNELSWMSDKHLNASQNGSIKPYSNLSCAVYDCILHWGQLNAGFHEDVIKDITRYLLKEIKVGKNIETKLRAASAEGNKQKGLSKKGKKRKMQAEIEQLSTNPEKSDVYCNEKLCHAALTTLFSVMMNFGDNMKKGTFQEIQLTLLEVVSLFQPSSQGVFPQPYNSPDCRKEIYHCLLGCVLSRPSGAPNAISCVIKYLNDGLQDMSFQVSNYCREALTITTALIHPVVPSIEVATKSLIFTNHVVQEISAASHHEQIIVEASERLEEEKRQMLSDSIQDVQISQKTLDSNHNQRLQEDNSPFSKKPQSVAQKTINEQTLQTNIRDSSIIEQNIENSSYQSSTESNKNSVIHVDCSNSMSSKQTETNEQKLHRTSQVSLGSELPGTSSLNIDLNCRDGMVDDNSGTIDEIIPVKRAKINPDVYHSVGDKAKTASDTQMDKQQQEIQDTDDVSEMIASFVNSSPDSD